MKKWALAAVAVVALCVVGFLAVRMFTPPPEELDLSRSKPSDNGIYRVEIAPEEEPVRQGPLHAWIVTLATAGGEAVADAALAIDGGMPQHGHGLPTAPQATGHLGEGRYRIEGVRFNMGGWWVLEIGIDSPAGSDAVTFNIML
mgnify:CR=1 FL=1